MLRFNAPPQRVSSLSSRPGRSAAGAAAHAHHSCYRNRGRPRSFAPSPHVAGGVITVARARKIERFLSPPFHVAEIFTGKPGKFVALDQSVAGFKGLLAGAYDDLPEAPFYMVGPIGASSGVIMPPLALSLRTLHILKSQMHNHLQLHYFPC